MSQPPKLPALEPTPEELEALKGPPLAVPGEILARATVASSAEVARMQPRRAKRGLPWGAMVAGAVVLLALLLPQGPGPVLLDREQPTELNGTLKLGLNMKVQGNAVLVLHQADRQGTEVELMSGQATFEVDPEGDYTDLVVRYGDWRVRTAGGAFRISDAPLVLLESGSAQITGPGTDLVLEGRRRWSPIPETAALDEVVQTEPSADLSPPEVRPSAPPPPTAPTLEPEVEDLQDPAEQAAFEALLLARAQDAQQTAPLADDFLAKWKDSPLAAEVQAIGLSAQLADPTLDPVRTLAKVDAWLSANPQHPRFVEMHYLRATLLRDQLHDCPGAIPSYRVVVQMGVGPQKNQAERYLRACMADQ